MTRQVANLVDLAPTLLSLAGGTVPEHIHGQDLTPVIAGVRESLDRDHSFIETEGDGIGIRTPTHVYGLPWSRTPGMPASKPHWFFDLTNDPYQFRNLAGTGEQSDLAAGLDRTLRAWNGAMSGMEG